MSNLSLLPVITVWPSPNASHEELPSYAATPQEQVSSISVNHKGTQQSWLTLNAKSVHTASSSSQTMPLYNKVGATVSGDIVLLLDKPEAIQAVKIALRGISSYAGSEGSSKDATLSHRYVFLEVTQTLWSSSEGRPRYAEPPPWGFPQNGKLQGKYTFHYSFQLPVEVPSEPNRSKDCPETFPLPTSLYDKKNPAAIDYELSATLVRGALKSNTILNLNFIYLPRIKPDPPSELRQSAYADGYPVLDPLGDPLGWESVVPPPKLKGKIANSHNVEVACMFALAKPLTYSRGSFIPLQLSIQCVDSQALQLLQSPAAVSIILLQRIITGKNAHSKKAKVGREGHLSPVARAVCWPSESSTGQGDYCRVLMGEIALPKKLAPSTVTPRVIVQYSVVLLPFDIAGFIPADPHSFVLERAVDIATHNAPGPPPRSQMPPGYADPRKGLTDRFEQMMTAMSKF